MVVEEWDSSWAPVIESDRRSQGESPRGVQRTRAEFEEPHSDAYLGGMPSRKRRCVRGTRPPHTLEGFMNESLREATDRAEAVDTSGIRTHLLHSMRSFIRTRTDSSNEYDPLRFTATATFLNPNRRHQKEETKAEEVSGPEKHDDRNPE